MSAWGSSSTSPSSAQGSLILLHPSIFFSARDTVIPPGVHCAERKAGLSHRGSLLTQESLQRSGQKETHVLPLTP